ncbi:hypothetical protein [Novosphingobium sp. NDB2Meth1]|uniref:hypothetical protein n=1 Tax=Novosphingobium sp. NDB2Meth1 TaxID=1892847 RepID=UPI00093148CD|nr:hypothetical protein [Novosphingobium sp. NDB2Meth1]
MNIGTTIATAFQTACDVEKRTREAAEQFHRDHVKPVYRAAQAGEATFDDSCAAEEAYDEYTMAHFDALKTMLATPAPTMSAVIHKIEVGCKERCFDGPDVTYPALKLIAADLRRLSGEA